MRNAGTDASTAAAVRPDWDGLRCGAAAAAAAASVVADPRRNLLHTTTSMRHDPLGVHFLSEASEAAFETAWSRTFDGALALPTTRVVPESELVRPTYYTNPNPNPTLTLP